MVQHLLGAGSAPLDADINLYGRPEYIIDWEEVSSCGGCLIRKQDDEHDDPC